MKTVIITAFEPFNKDDENPTEHVIAELPDFLYDTRIIKVTLPVIYQAAFDQLLPYIEEYNPALILMLGLAAGRSHISIERVAINVNHSKTPDNLGNIKHHEVIDENGPDGLFTTLPLSDIMKRMHKHKLPVTISNSAGTYVCNNLMYNVLYYIKKLNLDTKAGFIHVPYLPHQAYNKSNMPMMERRYMVETVTAIIDVLLNPIELDPKQFKHTQY
ncbi:MAG: pyroglutamyl-peptidase I [Bacillota bacterium]